MRYLSLSNAVVFTLGLALVPPFANAELSSETKQNHVLFQSGGTSLSAEAREQIETLGAVLNTPTMQNACLKLIGYSDQSGGTSANIRISQARADRVAEELMEYLDRPERIETSVGSGATDFLPEILPTDPRQRRVAIFVRTCLGIDGDGS